MTPNRINRSSRAEVLSGTVLVSAELSYMFKGGAARTLKEGGGSAHALTTGPRFFSSAAGLSIVDFGVEKDGSLSGKPVPKGGPRSAPFFWTGFLDGEARVDPPNR